MYKRQWRAFVPLCVHAFFALALLTGGVSCAAIAPTKPTIVITAPASGARVNAGAEVAVQSTAADARGIARIELWVDGAVVRSDALPAPQTAYTVIQRWSATTPSTHSVIVRAYNTAGAVSDPAVISIFDLNLGESNTREIDLGRLFESLLKPRVTLPLYMVAVGKHTF